MNRLCEESETYRNHIPLLITEAICAVACMPAFAMLMYIFFTRKQRPITSSMHFNFRLLLSNIWVVLMLQLGFTIFSNAYLLYFQIFDTEYCSNVFYTWQCSVLRWPLLWTVPAMIFIHGAAFVERLMATRKSRNYEHRGKRVALVAMIVLWLITITINSYVFSVPDMFEKLPYCLATFQKNQLKIKKFLHLLLPLELLITFGDICLWWVNRQTQKKTVYSDYSLSKSFQQSENTITSKLVLQISLLHSGFYIIYLVSTSAYRAVSSYDEHPMTFIVVVMNIHNIVVLGLTVCIIVYLWSLRVMDDKRKIREMNQGSKKNTEMYFMLLYTQLK
ncbi:unnamed protein product [Bursaphelenchus xylophilus]|uniref:(pine wood nematode) hypothetical protein n=1 Tax=Bursaphelenchus xylophilus TaxID=6326 RepID=A0A1I7SB88_BURXY|nr:unnamed protein product [Bursaphelenchus xylophilus]CAG9118656.1 unnamed protein product [Bursaphelenchus xylophilus]